MSIKPLPEFLEACRRVSGTDDDSPAHIIDLLCGPFARKIEQEYKCIVLAKEAAAEPSHKLDAGAPEDMGSKPMSHQYESRKGL